MRIKFTFFATIIASFIFIISANFTRAEVTFSYDSVPNISVKQGSSVNNLITMSSNENPSFIKLSVISITGPGNVSTNAPSISGRTFTVPTSNGSGHAKSTLNLTTAANTTPGDYTVTISKDVAGGSCYTVHEDTGGRSGINGSVGDNYIECDIPTFGSDNVLSVATLSSGAGATFPGASLFFNSFADKTCGVSNWTSDGTLTWFDTAEEKFTCNEPHRITTSFTLTVTPATPTPPSFSFDPIPNISVKQGSSANNSINMSWNADPKLIGLSVTSITGPGNASTNVPSISRRTFTTPTVSAPGKSISTLSLSTAPTTALGQYKVNISTYELGGSCYTEIDDNKSGLLNAISNYSISCSSNSLSIDPLLGSINSLNDALGNFRGYADRVCGVSNWTDDGLVNLKMIDNVEPFYCIGPKVTTTSFILTVTATDPLVNNPSPALVSALPDPCPNSSITLTWSAPSSASGLTGYNVYMDSNDGKGFVKYNSKPYKTSETSMSIVGLSQNILYQFYIKAIYGSTESLPSNTLYAYTKNCRPPTTPIITGKNSVLPSAVETYKVVSTDPDGDQVYYYVWLNQATQPNIDGSTLGWTRIPETGYVASGVEQSFFKTWPPRTGGRALWAQAFDSSGMKSDIGKLDVTITNTPVNTTGPASCTISSSATPVDTKTPFTLTWTTSNNPTSCTVQGSNWSGSKSVPGGSETITPPQSAGTYNYGLSCQNNINPAGSCSVNVTVTDANNNNTGTADPVVKLKVDSIYGLIENSSDSGSPVIPVKVRKGKPFTLMGTATESEFKQKTLEISTDLDSTKYSVNTTQSITQTAQVVTYKISGTSKSTGNIIKTSIKVQATDPTLMEK